MMENKIVVKADMPSQAAESVNECDVNDCDACTGICMKREVRKKRNSLEQMGNVSRITRQTRMDTSLSMKHS